MKQYNLGGLGANVELGKGGPKIVGSNSSSVAFNDASGNAVVVAVAEGTEPSHAVQKQQLDASIRQKISKKTITVNYNDSTVSIGTAEANTYIHKVVAESATTWTGADSSTNITVGDSGDVDRLFSVFDPDVQTTDETDHKYSSQTEINVYVTQGGARAGTAKVTIWYTGTIE